MSYRHLHVLEVGIRWPPETFLGRKFESLGRAGLRVTVASSAVFDQHANLPGVELIGIPKRGIGGVRALRVTAREVAALAILAPCRFVRLARCIRRAPSSLRAYCNGPLGMAAMYGRLARIDPDVVHFEWLTSATTYLPLLEVWRRPVVVSYRGTVTPRAAGREHHDSSLPVLLRRAAAVQCVCDAMRRKAISDGLDPVKAVVIGQGVDPTVFAPAPGRRSRSDGAFRVVTISWLRWMKGYEYALEAVAALSRAGVPVHYRIVGAPPPELSGILGERERILHTVAQLGLEACVELAGTASTAGVISALQQADVLLHPSVDEGLPNVVIEAMACGVPVVATECGGIAEAVSDGVQGFLAPPRDSAALTSALRELWRSPQLRARMGAAGRATVLARFTLERQRDELLSLYEQLV